MKKFLLIALIPVGYLFGMEEALNKLQETSMRNELHTTAFTLLSSDEQNAIGAEHYLQDQEKGRKALQQLSHHVIALAYQKEVLINTDPSFLADLKKQHTQQTITLREAVLDTKPIKVVNHLTANARAAQLLTFEEKCALQKENYIAWIQV